MSQRSILLVMLVSILAMFGGLIALDMKIKHKMSVKESRENWIWKDKWTESNNTPNPVQEEPEVKTDKPKEQIIASNYQDAVKKSEESGLPILIIFKAEWCHWCKKMESETLVDSSVTNMMMNYVYLTVDTDRDNATTRKFGVSGLPSYVIANSKGDKLKSDNGYKNAKKFCEWLDAK